jgi:hypothetical protein
MRYWLPAHAGFLAVADQNPSFTGCPTFTRQPMPKRKICLSFLLGNCHHFIATDPRPMGFPDLASAPALCAAALRRRSTASSAFRERPSNTARLCGSCFYSRPDKTISAWPGQFSQGVPDRRLPVNLAAVWPR